MYEEQLPNQPTARDESEYYATQDRDRDERERADRERLDHEREKERARERDDRERREDRKDRGREDAGERRDDNSVTTASLRREVDRDFSTPQAGNYRAKLHAQIDALEDRDVHRVERYKDQNLETAISDALTKEARRERNAETQEMLDEGRRAREGEGLGKTALDRGRDRQAEPSTAEWTRDYDVSQDAKTGEVTYRRDDQVKIRDNGRNLEVANDAKSIRDAVKLVKEQGVERIAVRAEGPEKRQQIMQEAIRQGVKVAMPTKEVEAEYTKAHIAVAREHAIAKRDIERQQQESAKENDGPEIG